MQGKAASFRNHKIELHSISVTLTQVREHLYATRAFWNGLSINPHLRLKSPSIYHQCKCRSFVLSLCMQHQWFPRTQQGCPGRRNKIHICACHHLDNQILPRAAAIPPQDILSSPFSPSPPRTLGGQSTQTLRSALQLHRRHTPQPQPGSRLCAPQNTSR